MLGLVFGFGCGLVGGCVCLGGLGLLPCFGVGWFVVA